MLIWIWKGSLFGDILYIYNKLAYNNNNNKLY